MAKGRRGNGEGTIRKRVDGRWEARISLEGGQRRSIFGKTRAEVAKRLSEILHEIDQGLPQITTNQTVRDYLTGWIETVRPTLGKASAYKYGSYMKLHVIPMLGSVTLAKLTAQHLQRLYAAKLNEGLSPTTVNLIHKVIHRALEDALRLGLVQRNISDLVDPPRRAHHEMRPLSADETRRLLEAVKGDRLEALAIVALTTGMRQGELMALKWRNVDLANTTLQVQTTAKLINGEMFVEETKTRRSRRRIALSPMAVEALKRHRLHQHEERLHAGERWQDNDYVFPNTIGKLLDPRSLRRRWFDKMLARAGLPHIRFHDLRHSAATLLLLQGVHPKIVSEMLGHASIAITLDLYSHVLPDMQRDASAAMERLLGGQNGPISSELGSELG
jgi:integrase